VLGAAGGCLLLPCLCLFAGLSDFVCLSPHTLCSCVPFVCCVVTYPRLHGYDAEVPFVSPPLILALCTQFISTSV